MKIVITGGAGFLGRRLAQKLLERGTLPGVHGGDAAIGEIVLVDVARAVGFTDPRVRSVVADLTNPDAAREVIDTATACVFHLAAVVSGQAESDFDLGMRVNVDASRALLEACRALGTRPRVVFTSSVAVYGGELPQTVLDSTALNPQSSYGIQKAICELLVSDYSRKGFVDGRVLRLPTISVRPGRPNKAASSFASGIVREPLNGEASVCPVAPDTRIWLLSPPKAIENLIEGMRLPEAALGTSRTINIPGVSVTVREMAAAVGRIAGPDVAKRIQWQLDPVVNRIVASWPGAWDCTRAHALGFSGDADFDAIVRRYMEDQRPR